MGMANGDGNGEWEEKRIPAHEISLLIPMQLDDLWFGRRRRRRLLRWHRRHSSADSACVSCRSHFTHNPLIFEAALGGRLFVSSYLLCVCVCVCWWVCRAFLSFEKRTHNFLLWRSGGELRLHHPIWVNFDVKTIANEELYGANGVRFYCLFLFLASARLPPARNHFDIHFV